MMLNDLLYDVSYFKYYMMCHILSVIGRQLTYHL